MFGISDTTLDDFIKSQTINPQSGAVVTFEGRVRNHNHGRKVLSLEYQCYQAMAVKEGQKILKQAREDFSLFQAVCIHRQGLLQIGEIAVVVFVQSAHRKEAFLACKYIIDRVKMTVPIWKKECYADNTCQWVACRECSSSVD